VVAEISGLSSDHIVRGRRTAWHLSRKVGNRSPGFDASHTGRESVFLFLIRWCIKWSLNVPLKNKTVQNFFLICVILNCAFSCKPKVIVVSMDYLVIRVG
jgi:hypothetical protein